MFRQRSRRAVGVESIEWVGDTEEMTIASTVASPESCLERQEKSTEIQQAIAHLPETLRDTFILHFYVYPRLWLESRRIAFSVLPLVVRFSKYPTILANPRLIVETLFL